MASNPNINAGTTSESGDHGNKPGDPMSEEDRQQLVQQLDNDLDQFILDLAAKNKGKKKEEKDIDEIIEGLQNHPAFIKDIDYSKPLSPEMEGLMRLKYEEEDPKGRAEAYKEDGNNEFKKKQYRIAVDNYTVGIKSLCSDKELNATLYSNRAAAHYHLGNFRSSLNDCILARKFKVDYVKAIVRGAMCCMDLKKYGDAISWCDSALTIEPGSEQMLELRFKADKLKTAQERDRRKEEAKERKQLEEETRLLETIKGRGIQLAGIKQTESTARLDPLLLTSLEVHNPSGAKVHPDENGVLHWPVLFLYPEHTQTDFIEAFCENDRFVDHLTQMFGPDREPIPWDRERTYTPDKLELYFEDKKEVKLYKLDTSYSLLKALQHKKYKVYGGTPAFILLVDGSKFKTEFLKNYKI